MLIAKPNAMILYATLAKGPKLPLEQQELYAPVYARAEPSGADQRHRCRGGFQNYPEDYEIIAELHAKEQMTVHRL
jgi:predicted amidohydrolase YtcJ